MTRVLHVITSLQTGGTQHALLRLLQTLDPKRFRGEVVTLIGGGAVEARMRDEGIEVTSLGMRRGAADPRAFLRLGLILRRRRPEIVSSWLYHADILATLAGRWGRASGIVWNLRCAFAGAHEQGQGWAGRAAPHLCARLSRRPAAIVTNSLEGRSSHEAIGYRPRRWVYIPNGFDVSRFRPDPGARERLRARFGLAPDAVLGCMVARWDPLKNHAALVEAAGRLRRRLPELRLLLVGDGVGSSNSELSELLERFEASGTVLATGPSSEVERILPGVDFVVSASRSEGFPNALGEALACGVPCVTTPAGDSAALVGEAGFVVRSSEPSDLTDGIERMARLEPARRRALGEAGRARILAEYTLEAAASRYAALFDELAPASRGA